jgi:Mg2+/Co2+ transporter CorB
MVPRVMSDALEIHPAAVLVMVIVSASLFGLLGVLLAAPVLASLKLIFTYVVRKMMDVDPWQELKVISPPPSLAVLWSKFTTGLVQFVKRIVACLVNIWKAAKAFAIRLWKLIKPNSGK